MKSRKFFLALPLLWASAALAQPGEGPRALLRDRVRDATIKRLIDRLALDPPTSARMAQVAKNFDDQIAAVQLDTGKAHRELKRLLDSGHADDASINRLADRIFGNRGRVVQLEQTRSAEFRKILRPADYGRLLLIWPQVNREIRAEILRALGPGAPGQPGEE